MKKSAIALLIYSLLYIGGFAQEVAQEKKWKFPAWL